jgi:hypothetical protein
MKVPNTRTFRWWIERNDFPGNNERLSRRQQIHPQLPLYDISFGGNGTKTAKSG